MGVGSRLGRRARLDEGQEGGILSHIDLSGTPSISEDQPSQLQAPYKARSGCQRRSPLMTPLVSTG
jgi:hypothetical protein